MILREVYHFFPEDLAAIAERVDLLVAADLTAEQKSYIHARDYQVTESALPEGEAVQGVIRVVFMKEISVKPQKFGKRR